MRTTRQRPSRRYLIAVRSLYGAAAPPDRGELVATIRRLAAEGRSDAEIARELGLDRDSVRAVIAEGRKK